MRVQIPYKEVTTTQDEIRITDDGSIKLVGENALPRETKYKKLKPLYGTNYIYKYSEVKVIDEISFWDWVLWKCRIFTEDDLIQKYAWHESLGEKI